MFRGYRRRVSAKTIFLIWGVVILSFVLMVDMRLRPLIQNVASYQAKTYATKAINNAIALAMVGNGQPYESLVDIATDENGRVTAVQTDTARLNLIKADLTDAATLRISQLKQQTISLPIGTLIGHPMLSGRGPDIEFKVLPAGYVESQLIHRFDSAGINQTRHQIVLDLTANIVAILPGYSTSTAVNTTVVLAETVIVGVSPEAFTEVVTGSEEDLAGLIEDYGQRPRN